MTSDLQCHDELKLTHLSVLHSSRFFPTADAIHVCSFNTKVITTTNFCLFSATNAHKFYQQSDFILNLTLRVSISFHGLKIFV